MFSLAETDNYRWAYQIERSTFSILSVRDNAEQILQMSREKICETIPQSWRILNVESVLRDDLAARFLYHRLRMRHRLCAQPTSALRAMVGKCRRTNRIGQEDLLDEILRPNVTFHGTPHQNVASIVKFVFKLPGTIIEDVMIVSPRSGIAVDDQGIHSSPEAFYALMFARTGGLPTRPDQIPGIRLFICATLMGNCYTRPGVHGPLARGFDSQMTDNGFESIVQDSAQILPCYVVSLDMTTPEATKIMREAQMKPIAFMGGQKRELCRRMEKKELESLDPGELRRLKQEKRMAAMKYFPLGFGAGQESCHRGDW